jgi:hypothetical protein
LAGWHRAVRRLLHVAAQRPADVDLIDGEAPIIIASDVPLVARMGLN